MSKLSIDKYMMLIDAGYTPAEISAYAAKPIDPTPAQDPVPDHDPDPVPDPLPRRRRSEEATAADPAPNPTPVQNATIKEEVKPTSVQNEGDNETRQMVRELLGIVRNAAINNTTIETLPQPSGEKALAGLMGFIKED